MWNLWRSISNTSSDSDEDRRNTKRAVGSWSRIAQRLKAKGTAKGRPIQSSLLLALPYELQDHIFSFLTKSDLLRLRAASWQLDLTLLEYVFNQVIIDCNASGSRKTGALLRHLSNRKSRTAFVAETLRIENLVPFTHPHQSDWQEQDVSPHLRPIQQNFLAPALKSFRNVSTIHLSVKVSDPYLSMCSTLASLPRLRHLYLYFDRWIPSSVFPFDKFGPLKQLHVVGRDYTGPVHRGFVESLGQLLSRCSELESFSFTLKGKLPECIPPSLKCLRLSSPSLWTGLGNLVSLDLPSATAEYTPIWEHLSGQGLQLRSITVEDLSDSFLDYLSTYSGLEQLVLNKMSTSRLLDRLYVDVLPRHRTSLFKLVVAPCAKREHRACALALHHLVSISTCMSMREIGVAFWFDPRVRLRAGDVPISTLIHTLSRLPHLQLATVFLVDRHALWMADDDEVTFASISLGAEIEDAFSNALSSLDVGDVSEGNYGYIVQTRDGEYGWALTRCEEGSRAYRFKEVYQRYS